MSIRDYSKKYIVINGTTNEQIPIPMIETESIVLKDYKLSQIVLIETILKELRDSDSVTICRTYMKG